MRLRTILTTGAAIAVAISTAIVVAPSASAQGAPIVWYQAVAVPSASSPCPVTSDAEKAAGWTEWTSSWDTWPNGGKGGYVCTRSITWAHEAEAAGGTASVTALVNNCIWAGDQGSGIWASFTDSHVAPSAPGYHDDACTDGFSSWGVDLVYASSQGGAQALCDTFAPGQPATSPSWFLDPYNPNVWACGLP